MLNKQYFKYLLKNNKNALIIIFSMMFVLFPLLSLVYRNDYFNYAKYDFNAFTTAAVYLAVLTMLFSFVLPFVNLNFKLNKRALDLYNSAPITKKKQFYTLTLFQLFEILVPFIINFLIGHVINIMCHEIDLKTNIQILIFFGITIIAVIAINFFTSMIILVTNHIIDAFIINVAYLAMPFLLAASLDSFLRELVVGLDSFPIIKDLTYLSIPSTYIYAIDKIASVFENTDIYLSILSLCLFAIVSFICYRIVFINKKSEDAEQLSDNFFAYPFVINFYLFAVLLSLGTYSYKYSVNSIYLILYAFIFLAYIVSDFVYKRKIKISVKKIITYVVLIVVINLAFNLLFKVQMFNISNNFPKNYDYINLRFNYNGECVPVKDESITDTKDNTDNTSDDKEVPSTVISDNYYFEYTGPSIIHDKIVISKIEDLLKKEHEAYYHQDEIFKHGWLQLDYIDDKTNTVFNEIQYRNNYSILASYSYSQFRTDLISEIVKVINDEMSIDVYDDNYDYLTTYDNINDFLKDYIIYGDIAKD